MKKIKLFALSIFSILLSLSFVSAFLDFRSASQTWIMWIQDIFGPFFEILLGSSMFLFERILFLFIMLVVIYAITKRLPVFQNNKAAVWIITIAISILSVRFLTDFSWIITILTPYSVLGISIASILPFMIYFYFIEFNLNPGILRRIAWILYGVIFLGLWAGRYAEVGTPSWIYFTTAVVALIIALAEKSVHRFFLDLAIEKGYVDDNTFIEQIVGLKNEIKEKMETYSSTENSADARSIYKEITDLRQKVKILEKERIKARS